MRIYVYFCKRKMIERERGCQSKWRRLPHKLNETSMAKLEDFIPARKLPKFVKDEREKVIRFLCRRYTNVNEEDADEAFYRGFFVLVDKINKGEFTEEFHEDSISKFLHTASKNHLLKIFNEKNRELKLKEGYTKSTDGNLAPTKGNSELPEDEPGTIFITGPQVSTPQIKNTVSDDNSPIIDEIQEKKKKKQDEADEELMFSILKDLPYPCYDVIWGHRNDKIPDAELALRLGYSSSDVVKTTRSRCMEKLENVLIRIGG